VVECLPRKRKALGSVPSSEKKEPKKKRPVSREFLGLALSRDLSGGLPHPGSLSLALGKWRQED